MPRPTATTTPALVAPEAGEPGDLLGLAGGAEADQGRQQALAEGLGDVLGARGEGESLRSLDDADDEGVGLDGGGAGAGQGEGGHGQATILKAVSVQAWVRDRLPTDGVHLDVAGAGRVSAQVLAAQVEHLQAEAERGAYVAEAEAAAALDAGRAALGALVGLSAADVLLTDGAWSAF